MESFRQKIKDETKKSLTFSKEAWVERKNQVIRGKVNYFLTLWKAINENKKYGREFKDELLAIDNYIRRRLRVLMIHDHPSKKKGHKMKTKWGIEFFARIGLVPAFRFFYEKQYGHTIEDYIRYMKEKQEKKYKRALQRAKERGEEYFKPKRVQMINCAQR